MLTADEILAVDDGPKTERDKGWNEGFQAGLQAERDMAAIQAKVRGLMSGAYGWAKQWEITDEWIRALAVRAAREYARLRKERGQRMTRAREQLRGREGWREKALAIDRNLPVSSSRKERAVQVATRLSLSWRTVYGALPSRRSR